MFGTTKKLLIALFRNIVNGSNPTKCVSLSNQKCMTQPTKKDKTEDLYKHVFKVITRKK